jgi:hypothetical protein
VLCDREYFLDRIDRYRPIEKEAAFGSAPADQFVDEWLVDHLDLLQRQARCQSHFHLHVLL